MSSLSAVIPTLGTPSFHVFDACSQFATVRDATWQYGWVSDPTGPLPVLFPFFHDADEWYQNGPILQWLASNVISSDGTPPGMSVPSVLFNPGTRPYRAGTIDIEPGELVLNGGGNPDVCPCVQWTCPATGMYAISAAVRGCDTGDDLEGTAATVYVNLSTITGVPNLARAELRQADPPGTYHSIILAPSYLIPTGSLIQLVVQPQGLHSATAVRLTIKRTPDQVGTLR